MNMERARRFRHLKTAALSFVVLLWMGAGPCAALGPDGILVAANGAVPDSVRLAEYYMTRRHVPRTNLILLTVPFEEQISGAAYEEAVAGPIRKYLEEKRPLGVIKCILTFYGIPLKVNHPDPADRSMQLITLKARQEALKIQIRGTRDEQTQKRLKDQLNGLNREFVAVQAADPDASVDSELALVFEKNLPRAGWIPNPLFFKFRGKRIQGMPPGALMVSRLDGPTPKLVRRMIDDALFAEKNGLKGTAYFDARWPEPPRKKKSGYAFYDQSIHRAARWLQDHSAVPVVLDRKQRLFQRGECPAAALYCGWYSLARYVDAFEWQRGAVGYHIASSECATLKKSGSRVWCKKMIEKGVAATLGPVSEPYVESFPPPDVFFRILITGEATLAECFALSNPFWSWKMVLLGDPLYRPFPRKSGSGNE